MSIRRYQLACAVLSATTVAALAVAHQRGGHAPGIRAAAADSGSGRAGLDRLRRPVRVSATALGLSEADLIDKLLTAASAREIAIYADKLAMVGTDDAVVALAPMVDDPRAGVAETVIGVLGRIGTPRASELVIRLADDPRPRQRTAAVSALGSLSDPRAEATLIAITGDRGDPARMQAIWALGELASAGALDHLVVLSRSTDAGAAQSAVSALGASAGGQPRLLALLDTADVRIRMVVIGAIEANSPEVVARLTKIIAAGELQTTQAALSVLGRSGDPSVTPILAQAARAGGANLRWTAISALGDLGGAEAVLVLGDLLAHADLDVVGQIASTLANLGDDDARAQLIAVALAGGRRGSAVLSAMSSLRGDEVADALLAIAKDGTGQARRDALPILVRSGSVAGLTMAADLARNGSRTDRLAAIAMLGESDAALARTTLLDVAERERGPTRTAALEALSQARPDDPALAGLLGDALLGGRPDEASAAASILARIGTPESRTLLVAALEDDDPARAGAAISALGSGLAITDDVRQALARLASSGPVGLRGQAIQQLIAAGGDDGVVAARALLDGDDPEAARQVLWSLASVGSEAADAAIRSAATSSDAGLRATAAQLLAQRPDDADAALLIQLGRDGDVGVKAQAMSSLGALGTREAVDALVSAATAVSKDDRIAAIAGLGLADDARAQASLARLIDDRDPDVAAAAIYASSNGGDEVDQALLRAFRTAGDQDPRRMAAAQLLRQRGTALDDLTAKTLDELLGASYGGYGYGGYGPYGE